MAARHTHQGGLPQPIGYVEFANTGGETADAGMRVMFRLLRFEIFSLQCFLALGGLAAEAAAFDGTDVAERTVSEQSQSLADKTNPSPIVEEAGPAEIPVEDEASIGERAESLDGDQSFDAEALLDMDLGDLRQIEVASNPFSGPAPDAESRFDADMMSANSIAGEEAVARNTTDAGSLLADSHRNPGVYVQQRSPIIGDPRIRGFRIGQYLARADGAFWYPVRLDVDSILSKVDSKIIDEVLVINGPYTSRYGPGFSFIDILTRPTPRYDDGFDWNGSSALSFNSNGSQWNANQYLQWGNSVWGGSVFYSHLGGSDYRDGARRTVPGDYESRNLNMALGFDLTDGTSIEFTYLRQDQTDVDVPGQFTDIDYLGTNGGSIRLLSEDCLIADRLSLDLWYNDTTLKGSAGRAQKQALFNSVFNQPAPNSNQLSVPRSGTSVGDVQSTGYSFAATWGDLDGPRFTYGTDLRYQATGMREVQNRPLGNGGFQTATESVIAGIPDASSTNPGLFFEVEIPATERLTLRTGGRTDWVDVHAEQGSIVRRGGNTSNLDVLGPERENSYHLLAGYVSLDYELTAELTSNLSAGIAERAPTLTELYAMRPFESVLQQGLNRIQGYPFLRPEQLTQIDWGLYYQSDTRRWSARVFHAWIEDYITSQAIADDPTSASQRITSIFANTPEATMCGGELFGEQDLTRQITCFGSVMYVEGTNRTLNEELFGTPTMPEPDGSRQGNFVGRNAFDQTVGEEPLPQIPPLEGRIGIRFQDRPETMRWGTEWSLRMVDGQDRVAARSLLEVATPGFTTLDFRGFWRPMSDITITYGVLNITDNLYREHLDNHAGNQLYQPGVSTYVGTEFSY